jgi:hypothetical protein
MTHHSANYIKRSNKTLTIIKTQYNENSTFNALAKKYGVWPMDIKRAVVHDYASPALVKAVLPPKPRSRFTADATPETPVSPPTPRPKR